MTVVPATRVARPVSGMAAPASASAVSVAGEHGAEQVGPVGVEEPRGEVVEREAEFRLLDPVLDCRLGAVPDLELVGGAFAVVGDERPVVPLTLVECELLALGERVAADDEPARLRPGARPPDEAGHLAAVAVAGRLPVIVDDSSDPLSECPIQLRADRVGDPAPLALGEEVFAVEALVGAQEEPDALGDAAQALGQETPRAGRGGGVSVAQLRVQPLARLTNETEQGMPGDLAGVDAACALPRPDRSVVLDVARVQVERQRFP